MPTVNATLDAHMTKEEGKANLNKEILSQFSGQEATLTIPVLYIKLTQSHEKALVLNQIIFYSNKSKLPDNWFYKSYAEWEEEVLIPERTMRRILKSFVDCEFIHTKTNKVGGKRVHLCKPHFKKIIESIEQLLTQPDKVAGVQDLPQTATLSCINVAPTGQSGRLQPDKVAVSIYTDNNLQIITSTSSSEEEEKFIISKQTDEWILRVKREAGDKREDEDILKQVKYRIDNRDKSKHTETQTLSITVKWIAQGKFDVPAGYAAESQERVKKKETSISQAYQGYFSRIMADINLKLLPESTKPLPFEQWQQQHQG